MKRSRFLVSVLFAVLLSAPCKANAPMLLRLQVDGNTMQNETVVYFDAGASMTYDPQYDALSLGVNPGYLNIVSTIGNLDFQVKGLPVLTQGISIPLKVYTGLSGLYHINTDGLQNLPSGACVFLYDNYTQTNWDLRGGSYTCFVSDTEKVSRFTLNIITSLLTTVNGISTDPSCTFSGNGEIIASAIGTGPWNYYWKDSLNNIIRTSLNKNTGDTLNGLNAGFYRVDMNTAGTCDNGTVSFTLEGSSSPRASFKSDSIAAVFANVSFISTGKKADSFWWDFGDGMGSADSNTTYSYSAAGIYVVSLTAYSSACNESSVFSKTLLVAGSTAIEQADESEKVMIDGDWEGYFIQFNYAVPTRASIQVIDMAGRIIVALSEQDRSNERIYLGLNGYENKIVLISVIGGNKEIFSKKIILR